MLFVVVHNLKGDQPTEDGGCMVVASATLRRGAGEVGCSRAARDLKKAFVDRLYCEEIATNTPMVYTKRSRATATRRQERNKNKTQK